MDELKTDNINTALLKNRARGNLTEYKNGIAELAALKELHAKDTERIAELERLSKSQKNAIDIGDSIIADGNKRIAELEKQLREAEERIKTEGERGYQLAGKQAYYKASNNGAHASDVAEVLLNVECRTYAEASAAQDKCDDYVEYCKTQPAAPVEDFESPAAQEQEGKKIKYKSGEPCNHVGCLSHVKHPCEGCGRVGGKGDVYFSEQEQEDKSK